MRLKECRAADNSKSMAVRDCGRINIPFKVGYCRYGPHMRAHQELSVKKQFGQAGMQVTVPDFAIWRYHESKRKK